MDETINQVQSGAVFGCCHRFRACSDAKRCLLPPDDPLATKSCIYRGNLEQGKIFYGKNANDFSLDEYNHFIQRYSTTTGSLRSALEDIILYCAGGSRLSDYVIWFNSSYLNQLQALGFISYTSNHRIVLDNYLMKELRTASGAKLRKKDELITHIINHQPDVLAQLSDPYCYLQIPKDARRYVEELYYDFYHATTHSRYTGSVPFANKVKELDDGVDD